MSAENLNSVRIVILASGSGSNALKIMERMQEVPEGDVVAVLTNRKSAGVLEKAAHFGVPTQVLSRDVYANGNALKDLLRSLNADLVVLAGYLKLIPKEVVQAYPQAIINIHPALLPSYGGKGMYGHNVHRAVIENGEKFSGITIHYVNEAYDEGNILMQKKLPVQENWTPDQLQQAILQLEHEFFPEVVVDLVKRIKQSKIVEPGT